MIELFGVRQLVAVAAAVGEQSHQFKLLVRRKPHRIASSLPPLSSETTALARTSDELPEIGV